MSVQPLLSQLQRDADVEIGARLQRARAEAAALLEGEAEGERRELRAALAEHERVVGQQLDRARDEVRRASLLDVLESRRRLVDRVLGRARSLAPELAADPAFVEAMRALVLQALEYLPPSDRRVRCHPAVARAAQDAGAASGVVETDPGVPFGFVAQTADGRVRVDATLDRLLTKAHRDLAMRIATWHGVTDASSH